MFLTSVDCDVLDISRCLSPMSPILNIVNRALRGVRLQDYFNFKLKLHFLFYCDVLDVSRCLSDMSPILNIVNGPLSSIQCTCYGVHCRVLACTVE